MSNETHWVHESAVDGYKVPITADDSDTLAQRYGVHSLAQQEPKQPPMSMAEAMAKYFRVETNSTILPYVVRDHAWNVDMHDASGNFYGYRDDAPAGYSEHMEFECPHQTNHPLNVVGCNDSDGDG